MHYPTKYIKQPKVTRKVLKTTLHYYRKITPIKASIQLEADKPVQLVFCTSEPTVKFLFSKIVYQSNSYKNNLNNISKVMENVSLKQKTYNSQSKIVNGRIHKISIFCDKDNKK